MMDVCFSVAAAGFYVLTVLWTLSQGHDAGHGAWVGALLWPLGASLCYVVSPVLCGLVLLSCSVRLIWDRKRCELLLPETRGVLITGCDSGFGHALAKRLSLMGVKVFAGMLDVDGAGAQRLRETSENLHVLQLDVTDRHQVETVHRDICSQVGHTDIFGTSDNVSRYRDEILEAASPDAREDYGDAYISSLPSGLSRLSQRSAEDLSPVVDDMCHALLSVHPKPLYTPGQMGWLLPFVHRHCPTAIFDVIVKTLTKYNDCEPAGLRTS